MVHRLQVAFATLEGELAYTKTLGDLVAAGDLQAAEVLLNADLAELDSELSRLCLSTPREAVTISGWAELCDVIRMHEGAPITGMTIGLANELDLAFEKEKPHDPILLHALYTDESFAWSSTPPENLLAWCAAEETPWMNREEDIELYLEIDGLMFINTALLRHKRRYFIRDDNPETAPRLYVEAVLVAWFRALRFHQAVATEVSIHGLPGSVAVLSGTVEMHADAAMVHIARGQTSDDNFASLSSLRMVRKPANNDEPDVTGGSAIRRKIALAQEITPPAPATAPAMAEAIASPAPSPRPSATKDAQPARKRGFFQRLFGWR